MLGHQQLVSECVEQLSRMFKVDYIYKRLKMLVVIEFMKLTGFL